MDLAERIAILKEAEGLVIAASNLAFKAGMPPSVEGQIFHDSIYGNRRILERDRDEAKSKAKANAAA